MEKREQERMKTSGVHGTSAFLSGLKRVPTGVPDFSGMRGPIARKRVVRKREKRGQLQACLSFLIHFDALRYLSLLCQTIHNIPAVNTVQTTSLPPRHTMHFGISLPSSMVMGNNRLHIAQDAPAVRIIVAAYEK